ncbi:unnamed protein product [Ectocarpus fasciculatus]
MKREAAASSNGTGSFFAFHGSAPGNWHGILRLGIKNMSGSEYMLNGASSGNGIYMADSLVMSLSYSTRDSAMARAAARSRGRLMAAELRATERRATPFPASAARVPMPAVVATSVAAATSSASGADLAFTPTAGSPANPCACGINPCNCRRASATAAAADAAAGLHACARDTTSAGASTTAANATSTAPGATSFGGSLASQGVAFRGGGGYGTRMNRAAVNRLTQAAVAAAAAAGGGGGLRACARDTTSAGGSAMATDSTSAAPGATSFGRRHAVALRGRGRYGTWMDQSAVNRSAQAASSSGPNTAVNAAGVAPVATALVGSLSTQGVAFRCGDGNGNGVNHSTVNRPTQAASASGSNAATNATSAAPAATSWMNQSAVNRPTQAVRASGSSTAANATSVDPVSTSFGGSLSTQGVAFGGRGSHETWMDQSAVNRPTQAASASGSNTAANATGVAPSATTLLRSLSAQGVAFRGRGGHGNRVDPHAVNVPQAPAIVAVCEVIDRPDYNKRSMVWVIPDESCVATRFLLIDPSRQFRFASGNLAAAAATRYASIHPAL